MKPAPTIFAAAALYVVAALPSFAAPGAFSFAPVPSPILGEGPAGLAIIAIAGAGYLAARAYRKRG